jgi:hypothetical protein
VKARFYREFFAYDPKPDLAAIQVPVLALTGDRDRQVDRGDLDVIAYLVPGSVQTCRVPHLTHILRRDPGPGPALSGGEHISDRARTLNRWWCQRLSELQVGEG